MSLLEPLRRIRELRRQQWLDGERLAAVQARGLRELIEHAAVKVPWYRARFAELGIDPRDVRSAADLARLPVLHKADLQGKRSVEFLADGFDPGRALSDTTSGSTGRPLRLYWSAREKFLCNLLLQRVAAAQGARLSWKHAVLTDPGRGSERRWRKRNRFARVRFLPSSSDPQATLAALRRFRPHAIWGYNASLALLAHEVFRAGRGGIAPRVVIGLAEMLDSSRRALIDAAFGVEMVDMYAAMESGVIGWECPERTGYHLNQDVMVVECLCNGQPAQPGQAGRIVVTPLYLRSQPLVRYDLGDIGVLAERACGCGRGLPLLLGLRGRQDDFLTLPSGRLVPPVGSFAPLIDCEDDVAEYLLVQESRQRIDVKLVLRGGDPAAVSERVRLRMEELVAHESSIGVEIVDRIERNGSPKLRRVVSKVPVEF